MRNEIISITAISRSKEVRRRSASKLRSNSAYEFTCLFSPRVLAADDAGGINIYKRSRHWVRPTECTGRRCRYSGVDPEQGLNFGDGVATVATARDRIVRIQRRGTTSPANLDYIGLRRALLKQKQKMDTPQT